MRVGLWRNLSAKKWMLLNCDVGEDSWESLGLQGDPTSPSQGRSVLGVHWKDWCWSWNSSTLATSCEKLTHWKRPWCWEGMGAGGEGDDRGWDGWMASPTWWTWVWVNSGSWWWTERPGVLRFMGSQRVRHDWATELIAGAHILMRVVSSSFMISLLLYSVGLWTQTETITLGFGFLSHHICVGQFFIISLFTYTHFYWLCFPGETLTQKGGGKKKYPLFIVNWR